MQTDTRIAIMIRSKAKGSAYVTADYCRSKAAAAEMISKYRRAGFYSKAVAAL